MVYEWQICQPFCENIVQLPFLTGRDADPSPPSSAMVKKEQSYISTPPMGRTVCTESQCLYMGALSLPFLNSTIFLIGPFIRLVQSE